MEKGKIAIELTLLLILLIVSQAVASNILTATEENSSPDEKEPAGGASEPLLNEPAESPALNTSAPILQT
ncbi:MAG: hypothetical protein ACUVQ0_00365 [Thermoproteota archaeon]